MIADAGMEEVKGDERVVPKIYRKPFYAPWYTVPEQLIVSVEHPFIIKDVDKGLAMLGSPRKLQEVCPFRFDRRQSLMFPSSCKKMVLSPVCI